MTMNYNGFQMPRMDRLATLYLCHPAARLLGFAAGPRVPILMYHSISDNLFAKSHPYYQINTSPNVFARQMRWLRQNGYRTMDLPEMLAAMQAGQDLSKIVVITFDDGYQDFYTDALAVMKQCGFTATIFLATNRIQDVSVRVEGADYLTWRDVRELHAEGIQFGSHTVTHPDLRSLGPEQIDYELGYSKEIIEQKLGAQVPSFSYPFAFPEEDRDFTRYLLDALANHGFENGVSTILGRARPGQNPFCLPRLPVNSWDDATLLRAKLEGGYDWMHWPQWFHKFLHHNVSLMQRSSSLESDDTGRRTASLEHTDYK
jgi:peptidoglycan/xylan/chitin deacetylase (PgdA/CDA1 family)